MAHAPATHSGPSKISTRPKTRDRKLGRRDWKAFRRFALFIAVILMSPLILAQSSPQVTSDDPPSGKVNDSVTVTGADLAKGSVSAVFLSNDKEDFKATIVEQSAGKIILKIPQVKAGNYNISVQVGDKILIKPVRFTVEE